MALDQQIESLIPSDWMWALYSVNGRFKARAVWTLTPSVTHRGPFTN